MSDEHVTEDSNFGIECSIKESHAAHTMRYWSKDSPRRNSVTVHCRGIHLDSTGYVSPEADRWRRMHQLATLMVEWAEGRRSMNNEFMAVEADPQRRLETLVAIAQADAAEVQKLSAAVQALIALDGRTR